MTRQLAERIPGVCGSDADEKMIEAARQNSPGMPYSLAPASRLPYDDRRFDAATACSAFHWFTDRASVAEIKRVLKSRGLFVVVHRDRNAEPEGYLEERIIEKILGTPLPDKVKMSHVNATYDPERTLRENGFTDVESQRFPSVERSTVGLALRRMEAMSIWSATPEETKPKALDALAKYLRQKSSDGKRIERDIEWLVVRGSNKGATD